MSQLDQHNDYTLGGLSEDALNSCPFEQLGLWLADAERASLREPNAMALATASAAGQPSVRIVLLRGLRDGALVFFTNLDSHKGSELLANPLASLLFFWAPLERQVRIEGRVQPVADEESDAYFGSRPRGSQIGAWASPQSSVISSREALESRVQEFEARFPGDVPRPPNWGGLALIPASFEFWQGRPSRLHDRLRYHRFAGEWRIERLAP